MPFSPFLYNKSQLRSFTAWNVHSKFPDNKHNLAYNLIISNTKSSVCMVFSCVAILLFTLISLTRTTITRDVFIYASYHYENSSSFLQPVGKQQLETVVFLILANRHDDNFPYMRCAASNKTTASITSANPFVPALITRSDYTGICELVIFVAWCHFPKNALAKSGNNVGAGQTSVWLDMGPQILADDALKDAYLVEQKPLLHKISATRADAKPKQLVMCISRMFAFEQWKLLLIAMETYRAMGIDLVVTHVYSAVSPVFELIQAYEAEDRLAIRKGVRFPYLSEQMNFDPEKELEYSGQLAMAHDCFYEFRASARFIGLVDWDDLLVSVDSPTLGAALQAATKQYEEAAYFYVNKLESGVVIDGGSGAKDNRAQLPETYTHVDNVNRMLRNSIYTKLEYNNEKMVVRPERLTSFWVHFSNAFDEDYKPVQLASKQLLILHLNRELNHTQLGVDEYGENLLSSLDWTNGNISRHKFFGNSTVQKIIAQLPTRSHYFKSIQHCSRYMNAYPSLVRPSPCLSYSVCEFPRLDVQCTVARTKFHSQKIGPANIFTVHIRTEQLFERRKNGCFDD